MNRSYSNEYLKHLKSPEWKALKWERSVIAKGRCEVPNCKSPFWLEGHHTHYRDLSAIKAKDIRILCVPHHIMADLLRLQESGKTGDYLAEWLLCRLDKYTSEQRRAIIEHFVLDFRQSVFGIDKILRGYRWAARGAMALGDNSRPFRVQAVEVLMRENLQRLINFINEAMPFADPDWPPITLPDDIDWDSPDWKPK